MTISKLLLLVVALVAAYAASLKPGDILSLVGAAFSLAASTLFPALVAGVFWRRANQPGAIAGMLTGFAVCAFYMLHTNPALGGSAGRPVAAHRADLGRRVRRAGRLRRAGAGQPAHQRAGRAHPGIHRSIKDAMTLPAGMFLDTVGPTPTGKSQRSKHANVFR